MRFEVGLLVALVMVQVGQAAVAHLLCLVLIDPAEVPHEVQVIDPLTGVVALHALTIGLVLLGYNLCHTFNLSGFIN